MKTQDITCIKQLLSSAKKIVIVPHKNPDGDAIGSTLGLYHYLVKGNHDVTVITPNDYPHFLKWIPGNESILKHDTQKEVCEDLIKNADIIFTLDFNAFHRTGQMETVLTNSKALKIMIDHHQAPDDYATYTYSDVSMSSTCEMVYNFIDFLGDENLVDSIIATCLYVGIMTDTGSFRFRSTTSKTHAIISKLIDKGANNNEIHNNVYDTNSYERLQLLGCALTNLKVIPESRAAYITLSQDELQQYNYKKGDTEGVVNYGLSLDGVVLAAIFIEDRKEGIIKISLRSKGNFSVNEMSRAHFEGGGHTNAAGGKSDLSLQETVEKFISILPSYNKALNNE
ncbi:bifunctional oligoribonuclease/PAP phosphatase NrnA [Algibacter amylolyticus]|uniref:Bifunctional oligoribonuclease/PAP phosphatase NrnA n=1 Tax=Algibacter amylolyticus TaxID=1608400 RepID=A0A5M7BCI4_9FLAO|nr:bifunctional oligoribonuclease/PAP phosphatase NrnA [Algibacter amylolyticus]KAA5825091.1 bifunctional oligoribonuclease/PAP phosphatase NrnA [Algibacter amylolyticus]MBB5268802.1 phosphoesterase RecJ-like protein [Algibacter amylolyticus]TSJ77585.1 bifunctional oligoribonuclease/PAP phosphatase NrnA [Algibacter amylolyticus]